VSSEDITHLRGANAKVRWGGYLLTKGQSIDCKCWAAGNDYKTAAKPTLRFMPSSKSALSGGKRTVSIEELAAAAVALELLHDFYSHPDPLLRLQL
jgi:hypothetical protein